MGLRAKEELRAVEKSDTPLQIGPAYRAESLKPGTARLIEDHAVLQYELRNGESLELASYPSSIEGAATLEYGDTFCLVGGFNKGTRELRKTVLCWNPLTPPPVADGKQKADPTKTGGWVALPDMLHGRHQPGSVVMDGKLFVAGGYDTNTHQFLAEVEVFDDVTRKWYSIAPLRHPRAGLRLVAVGGKLLAMGGWRNHRYLDVVEEYDPLRNEWTEAPAMSEPRAKFGAVARGNEVFVVGGMKGFRHGDQLRSIEVYESEGRRWRQLEEQLNMISGPTWATLVKPN